MSKKPALGLVGLVWAGMLAAGCGDCCRSNTRKDTPLPPPVQMKTSSNNERRGMETTRPVVPVDSRGGMKDAYAPPEKPQIDAPITSAAPGMKTSALPPGGAAPGGVQALKQADAGVEQPRLPGLPIPAPPTRVASTTRSPEELSPEPAPSRSHLSDGLPGSPTPVSGATPPAMPMPVPGEAPVQPASGIPAPPPPITPPGQ